MRNLRAYIRLVLSAAVMAVAPAALCATAPEPKEAPQTTTAQFADETLEFHIVYHWGLIWKHAATAQMSIRSSGGVYRAQLTAHTRSWADKMYRVRDTLSCTIEKNSLRPTEYVKSTHEGKHSGTDRVRYTYKGDSVYARCTRIRSGKANRDTLLASEGKAYDMLSVFYYLRQLDFDRMLAGDRYKTTMFSGKRKELLSIRCVGIEEIELRDKTKHQAYHIKFRFTQDGQKKSSDDIDTWISTDSRRIPLMLRGKVSIGEIRCYYVTPGTADED